MSGAHTHDDYGSMLAAHDAEISGIDGRLTDHDAALTDLEARLAVLEAEEPAPEPEPEPPPSVAFTVATTGSDDAPGSEAEPWGTLQFAFEQLGPGDTLIVRGGTYAEYVHSRTSNGVLALTPGTQAQPITVRAAEGETVTVSGAIKIRRQDWWTFDGINVTYNGSLNEELVVLRGGVGWRWTNSEVSHSRSVANILVGNDPTNGSPPSGWRIDHNYIHHNDANTHLNGDHLIYVNSSCASQRGLIERNILTHSPNGRGVKLGPGSAGMLPCVGNVEVRYNTLYKNWGPSNVQVSFEASNNLIHHNIMVGSGPATNPGNQQNVTRFKLTGTDNQAWDNIGWDSAAVIEGGNSGLVDTGGNLHVDPQFVDAANGDFHTLNPTAADYGRYAGETHS